MVMIYLVRHGRALGRADGDFSDRDPPLDEIGQKQAEAFAEEFGARVPLTIVSSPMVRAQETAAPLARQWNMDVRVDHGVTEIVSPANDPVGRGKWIKQFMLARWSEAPAEQQCWRANLVRCLAGFDQDTMVFTHYMVINAAVAEATSDDRTVVFSPENCSITVFQTIGEELHLISRGAESGRGAV